MKDPEMYALSNKIPGLFAIDSEEGGLHYILDEERQGIVISGIKGKTGLTRYQFLALCREVKDIAKEYFGVTV